jgi:hypothetical protein
MSTPPEWTSTQFKLQYVDILWSITGVTITGLLFLNNFEGSKSVPQVLKFVFIQLDSPKTG